jgi:very-short-patch-repair endonuclease
MQPYPPKQKINARRLRRTQTDAESKLWTRLRGRQLVALKFRRQHPLGPFIVDFCCVERGLAIELDGGQHATQTEPGEKDPDPSAPWLSGFAILG